MNYRSHTVRVDAPPGLFDDRAAFVTCPDGTRMALERGDVSWASWVLMSAAPSGTRIDILVRK